MKIPGALSAVVLLLIAGQCPSSAAEEVEGPLVELPLGKLRGAHLTSRAGRRYMAFTGVPYAKPPIGELRFKPPEPIDSWKGELDARQSGYQCLQYNSMWFNDTSKQNEDCLYLDVFTHDTNVSRKAPVLVNIHGGGFLMGYKDMVKPTYIMDQDIVVVTLNYRLAIFGFLTFETKELAGNQGLKDQAMALRWVKENIASFGGDPDKVTIMGQSAGGASVYHLLLSPLAKGLFHRAISSSGSTYNPWALSPPGLARKNAEKLMKLLDCPTSPQEAIQCARKKDGREIADKFKAFMEFQNLDPMLTFSPVLEEPGPGAFLEGPITKLETAPVPFMVVMSSAEGLFRTFYMQQGNNSFKDLTDNLEKNLPLSLSYWASASNPNEVTKKVWDYYFPGKKELSQSDIANMTMMYSDAWFTHGIIKGANKHKGDAYFWLFDYLLEGTPEAKVKIGANHCGEAFLLWEYNINGLTRDEHKSEEARKLSEKLVAMVTHFMETGVPTIPGSSSVWKTWTASEHNYLHQDNTGFKLKTGLFTERFNFWDSLDFQDKFYQQTENKA